MFRIVREVNRPQVDLVNMLGAWSTPLLSDVMGRGGAMDSGIKPIADSMRLAGPAITVKTYTADNLMCHLALKLARPGDVLVIDGDGYCEAGVWGELLTLSAKSLGIAGVVIDGAVRDRLALRELGLPVFARGTVPAGTFKVNLGEINVPIACGGLSVRPGDVMVGDADGVVVVPLERLRAVAELAGKQAAKEEEMRRRIEAGEILYDFLGLERYLEGQPVQWE